MPDADDPVGDDGLLKPADPLPWWMIVLVLSVLVGVVTLAFVFTP